MLTVLSESCEGPECIHVDFISSSWYSMCGSLTPAVLWSILLVTYSEGHWHVSGHLEDALSEKNGVVEQAGGKPMWTEGGASWKFLRISQGIQMTGTEFFLSTEQRPAKWMYRRLDLCSTVNFWDFSGGPVVENPLCNAGDMSFGARIPRASEQLSPHATTRESPHHNERPHKTQWRSCVPKLRPNN